MKKIRNQDIASIIAIFALVCHFCTLPITRKGAVFRTRLSLMENYPNPSQELINREKSEVNFYKRTGRAFECAAILFVIISVFFCYRAIKDGEPGALVSLGVLLVVFLLLAIIK